MLYVNTILKPSEISGVGLFADEPISKGTVVWKFEPLIDLLLSEEEITKLSNPAKKQFFNYSYLDKTYNKYLLCGDDARFFNHSINCNCDDRFPNKTIAIRNIAKGEELTVNYHSFYGNIENYSEIN